MRLTPTLLAALASLVSFGVVAAPANDEEPIMQTACDDKPGTTAAAGTNDPTDTECLTPTEDAKRDARAYWTPERMRNAKPLPTPTVDPDALKPKSD